MWGYDSTGNLCLIKLNIEFHLVKNFEHKILLGMDTLSDYRIDFYLSMKRAQLGSLSYPINYDQKFKTILVREKSNVTIYGKSCKKIPIKSHMVLEGDYIFTLYQFLQ